MGWLSGWGKRIILTADKDDIDAVLSNFPILLYISALSGRNSDDISCVFDELLDDANRKKIAVTTSDGETQCYVEIEKWDDANEQAWLWVKVPSIASDADTDLYLYYDKDHADNTDYIGDPDSTPAENVWDANFKFVSHMRDDPGTSNIRDSTNNNNDGTKKAANEPAVTTNGKIDDAQSFDGSDDEIDCGDFADAIAAITAEIWLNPGTQTQAAYYGVLAKAIDAEANSSWNIYGKEADSGLNFFIANDAGLLSSTGYVGNVRDGSWHRVVLTWDASGDGKARGYIDGSLVGTSADARTGTIQNTAIPVQIGRYNTAGRFYKGILDEVRISHIARSAAWIKASYESERDHLLDWGSEEEEEVEIVLGLKNLVEVHESNGDLVAILQNAHNISYEQVINSPHALSFALPADDAKMSDITLPREIWIRNYKTEVVIRKFILQRKTDNR